jgi:hypothetical protein
VATNGKLVAIAFLAGALAAPAFAFETRPNPNITGGSVRVDGHDLNTTCGHAKDHRSSLRHALCDEILTRYGLSPGTHPDYEIDHLIPLCLGGADDPSNLWAQPRRSIEPTWNAEAKDRLERLHVRQGLQPATRSCYRAESLRRGLDRRISQILRSALTKLSSTSHCQHRQLRPPRCIGRTI